MRSRGVVGKRIVRIIQRPVREPGYPATTSVQAIVLEDGTELRPIVHEGEADYSVDMIVCKPRKGGCR